VRHNNDLNVQIAKRVPASWSRATGTRNVR
jgi:hypothetical protein